MRTVVRESTRQRISFSRFPAGYGSLSPETATSSTRAGLVASSGRMCWSSRRSVMPRSAMSSAARVKFGPVKIARQGVEVHELRFVQAEFGFGAKNARHRFVEARHRNSTGGHRLAHCLRARRPARAERAAHRRPRGSSARRLRREDSAPSRRPCPARRSRPGRRNPFGRAAGRS